MTLNGCQDRQVITLPSALLMIAIPSPPKAASVVYGCPTGTERGKRLSTPTQVFKFVRMLHTILCWLP